ncbi:GNAT family N-acetyltransferase [Methylobacillus caricis]|uniref:GNAT family N-acetyltransferase n=1 Tax=Methylobacillus caricis TaxID=1971611 RepID=UPI001CFF577D|nr:GNAT family N-acetyltransferase [Methylobacillus caricis]MCB5186474.1 GNAT family N-acetyltransferase [Methylobacillus caricis]
MPGLEEIIPVTKEADIRSAFDLMRHLRAHLTDPDVFFNQVMRQFESGYRLAGLRKADQWLGLVGFRVTENLLYGRFVYVDDLIVHPGSQNQGIGRKLIETCRNQAIQLGCANLVLDTGLHMAYAQRFYFRQGLLAEGLHFVEQLQES